MHHAVSAFTADMAPHIADMAMCSADMVAVSTDAAVNSAHVSVNSDDMVMASAYVSANNAAMALCAEMAGYGRLSLTADCCVSRQADCTSMGDMAAGSSLT